MTLKRWGASKRKRPGRLSPELQRRIMESIAAESDALIKPLPPVTSYDARHNCEWLRIKSEWQFDREMLITVVVSLAIVALFKIILIPSASWLTLIIPLLGVVTLVAGAFMLAEVPVVYDHRVCRRCVYPYDEEAQPDQCPECGTDLTLLRSVGYWRPWRPKLRKYLFWTLLTTFLVTLAGVLIWG